MLQRDAADTTAHDGAVEAVGKAAARLLHLREELESLQAMPAPKKGVRCCCSAASYCAWLCCSYPANVQVETLENMMTQMAKETGALHSTFVLLPPGVAEAYRRAHALSPAIAEIKTALNLPTSTGVPQISA